MGDGDVGHVLTSQRYPFLNSIIVHFIKIGELEIDADLLLSMRLQLRTSPFTVCAVATCPSTTK